MRVFPQIWKVTNQLSPIVFSEKPPEVKIG